MWGWLRDAANAVVDAVADVVEAVGEVISDTADTVADAVETFFNAVGEALSDLFDTLGGWLRDLGAPPDPNEFPDGDPPRGSGLARWLARALGSALEAVGAAVKAVFNLAGGLLAGAIRVLGGLLSFDFGMVVEGLVDILVALVGAVLLVAGKLLSLAQHLVPVERPARRLDEDEWALLRRVYHDSLSLFNIRIVENRAGAGIFAVSSAPFVLGNTIYMKNTPAADWDLVLVHESVHVWQYQQEGIEYLGRAIGNQIRGDGTASWLARAAAGDGWEDFGWEDQAWFIEDVWEHGELVLADGSTDLGAGAFFDFEDPGTTPTVVVGGVVHTALAVATTLAIRARRRWRLSALGER